MSLFSTFVLEEGLMMARTQAMIRKTIPRMRQIQKPMKKIHAAMPRKKLMIAPTHEKRTVKAKAMPTMNEITTQAIARIRHTNAKKNHATAPANDN